MFESGFRENWAIRRTYVSILSNGTDGLIPDFVRDYTIPLTVNEVYFHLGMINTSQRYVFEAMEANPSYHKSTRCIRRLAETNLLNGEYKVAAKYLNLLKHTLFIKMG